MRFFRGVKFSLAFLIAGQVIVGFVLTLLIIAGLSREVALVTMSLYCLASVVLFVVDVLHEEKKPKIYGLIFLTVFLFFSIWTMHFLRSLTPFTALGAYIARGAYFQDWSHPVLTESIKFLLKD